MCGYRIKRQRQGVPAAYYRAHQHSSQLCSASLQSSMHSAKLFWWSPSLLFPARTAVEVRGLPKLFDMWNAFFTPCPNQTLPTLPLILTLTLTGDRTLIKVGCRSIWQFRSQRWLRLFTYIPVLLAMACNTALGVREHTRGALVSIGTVGVCCLFPPCTVVVIFESRDSATIATPLSDTQEHVGLHSGEVYMASESFLPHIVRPENAVA